MWIVWSSIDVGCRRRRGGQTKGCVMCGISGIGTVGWLGVGSPGGSHLRLIRLWIGGRVGILILIAASGILIGRLSRRRLMQLLVEIR